MRRWLLKDKNCSLYLMFSEQMPLCELAIKHSLGLQTEEIRLFQAIKWLMTFQQSSQANALQWALANVTGSRKEHFCKWHRGLRGVREPLSSAPRESFRRMSNSPSCPSSLWQVCDASRAQSSWRGLAAALLLQGKNRTGRLSVRALLQIRCN